MLDDYAAFYDSHSSTPANDEENRNAEWANMSFKEGKRIRLAPEKYADTQGHARGSRPKMKISELDSYTQSLVYGLAHLHVNEEYKDKMLRGPSAGAGRDTDIKKTGLGAVPGVPDIMIDENYIWFYHSGEDWEKNQTEKYGAGERHLNYLIMFDRNWLELADQLKTIRITLPNIGGGGGVKGNGTKGFRPNNGDCPYLPD